MTHTYETTFGSYRDVIENNSGAMLFDQSLCIGCRACQVACKRWNDREPLYRPEDRQNLIQLQGRFQQVPSLLKERHLATGVAIGPAVAESFTNPFELEAQTWLFMRFNEFGEEGNSDTIQWLFTRVSCMHCVEAPCVYACPTTALWKHPEGPVELRTDLCIGCRNCIQACPFDVPRFNEHTGVVEKCTLCADRIGNKPIVVGDFDQSTVQAAEPKFEVSRNWPQGAMGGRLEPACVETCPTDALKWGPRSEIVKMAQQRAAQIGGYTYGIEEVGGTNVIYVLQRPPHELGLPTVFKERVSARMERLLGQTAGIGVVAGLAALFAAALRWISERRKKVAAALRGA